MAGDVVAALFDSDFCISDGDSSRKEDGEDIYADMGNATIERWRLPKKLDTWQSKKMLVVLCCKTLKTSNRTEKHRILIIVYLVAATMVLL